MKFLLDILKKQEHHFKKGGKLNFLYPLWDANETAMFTTDDVTQKGPHIRDAVDLKRFMVTVIIALVPALLFGIYNAGYQSARALGIDSQLSHFEIIVNGAWIVLPIVIVCYATGLIWENIFAHVRGHHFSEGFLVTGILLPLTLPPTIPLWQVVLGVSFGVVIGKEIFGGTGMNILNPALTARAFLFFSFPAQISGADPWVMTDASKLIFAGNGAALVDGFTAATPLMRMMEEGATAPLSSFMASTPFHDYSLSNLLLGLTPGAIGETSALILMLGGVMLLVHGVASWRIMFSVFAGGLITAQLISMIGGSSNPIFELPAYYHLFMGGFMLGAVFMATDPVSAANTGTGKYIYGFLIGAFAILVRLFNPAYPEGMMLAILFMNTFAPLIDHYVIQSRIKRRLSRAKTAG